jgi:hypothetical protein
MCENTNEISKAFSFLIKKKLINVKNEYYYWELKHHIRWVLCDVLYGGYKRYKNNQKYKFYKKQLINSIKSDTHYTSNIELDINNIIKLVCNINYQIPKKENDEIYVIEDGIFYIIYSAGKIEQKYPSYVSKEEGEIYVIENNGFYKIGKTTNVENRIKQFETSSALPYTLIYKTTKHKYYHYFEKFLHRKFKHKHIKGEWFNLSEDDIKYFNHLSNIEFIE